MTYAIGHMQEEGMSESTGELLSKVVHMPGELIRRMRAAIAHMSDPGKHLEEHVDRARMCWCLECGDMFLRLLYEYQIEMQTTTARLDPAYVHGSLSLVDITEETFWSLGMSREEIAHLLHAGSLRRARMRIEEAKKPEPATQGNPGAMPGLMRGFQKDEKERFLADVQHAVQCHREITLDFIPESLLQKLGTTLPELKQLAAFGIIHTRIVPLIRNARKSGFLSPEDRKSMIQDFLEVQGEGVPPLPGIEHISDDTLARVGTDRSELRAWL